jgi:tellurite resistance protein TerC
VLILVGIKMMTHGWLKGILGEYFNLYVLGVVIAVLVAGVIASLLIRKPAPVGTAG